MSETNAVSNGENAIIIDAAGDSESNAAKRRRMENDDGVLGFTEVRTESYIPLVENGEPAEHKEEEDADLRGVLFRQDQAIRQLQDTVTHQNDSLKFLIRENRIREEQTMGLQRQLQVLESSPLRFALPAFRPVPFSVQPSPMPSIGQADAALQPTLPTQSPMNSPIPSPFNTQSPSPIVDVVGLSSRQITSSPPAQTVSPISAALTPSPSEGSGQTSSALQAQSPGGGKITEKKKRGRKPASPIPEVSTPSTSQGSDQTTSTPQSADQSGEKERKQRKKGKSAVEKLTDWTWIDKPSPKPRRKLSYKKDE